MSNIDKATEILTRLDEWIDLSPENAVEALADAGLIAPDLPEPKLYGELAEFGDEEVFAARGTRKVRIYIYDARMISEEARKLALMLLAAANYAEEKNQ